MLFRSAKILFERENCTNFFVAHAVEGAEIRSVVENSNIFVLQGIGEDNIDEFRKHKLIPVISCPDMFNFWKQNKICDIKPVIHIDTGLNRLGFRENEIKSLSQNDIKEFSMVMSHLACGDEKNHFMNEQQIAKFISLKNTYFANIPASLSASDGVFLGKDFHFDVVRLGAAMYGINTTPYRDNKMKNIISLKAPVLQIEEIMAGEYVGYSATYQANSTRKIAIISIGYGDGVPRSLSNIGKVIFYKENKIYKTNILGRISMDNIICDVTEIENLDIGDFGFLISDDYNLDDIAKDASTISYVILLRIG